MAEAAEAEAVAAAEEAAGTAGCAPSAATSPPATARAPPTATPTAALPASTSGVDLADGSCGDPIYAAHSGTVAYAGYNGGYGNYVASTTATAGLGTGYGHIIDGGFNVYCRRVGRTPGR